MIVRLKVAVACLTGAAVMSGTSVPLRSPKPGPGGWTRVLDRPSAAKYEDFAFPDSIHGWMVSAAGDILNTTDGGVTWTEQAHGMVGLRSVDFLDARRGFAGTLNGKLFATTDGGATWTNISSTLPRAVQGFCGMAHVGEQVHIVGKYVLNATDYFRSPDGGKTWQYSNLSDLAQGLVEVQFVSDQVGFIGGMGKSATPNQGSAIILKTTDGGNNWHPVFHHDGGRGYAWKIFPISRTLMYASLQSQDGIYRAVKTTDGGDHWDTLTVATSRPPGPGVQAIGFIDANNGWVGGFFRGMFATTDGGRTWTELYMNDALINRFDRAGSSLFTAGSGGIMRIDARSVTH